MSLIESVLRWVIGPLLFLVVCNAIAFLIVCGGVAVIAFLQ